MPLEAILLILNKALCVSIKKTGCLEELVGKYDAKLRRFPHFVVVLPVHSEMFGNSSSMMATRSAGDKLRIRRIFWSE